MAVDPRLTPSTCVEETLWASGYPRVAGVDEVGRGPLAGPVFAAAVILDPTARPGWVDEVRDSKVLLAPERERLARAIRDECISFAVGWSTVAEIDTWGISRANTMAMVRAIDGLGIKAQHVLIDGPLGIPHSLPQRSIVDGDATCCSIAAASIVAKVARDAFMCEVGRFYPEYRFQVHKGYSTKDHLDRIEKYGASNQHRRSWLAVRRRAGLPIESELQAIEADEDAGAESATIPEMYLRDDVTETGSGPGRQGTRPPRRRSPSGATT